MPENTAKTTLLLTITLPWLVAQLLTHHPVFSFIMAFMGSFFIFYATILSPICCVSNDRMISQQVMRPIILLQLIFAGYMCCTSIFYFLDHLGYEYLSLKIFRHFHVNEQTYLLARSQRMVLLGHIALVAGIIAQQRYKVSKKFHLTIPLEEILFKLSIATMLVGFSMNYVPFLLQFKYYLLAVSVAAQAYLIIIGLYKHKPMLLLFGGICFGLQVLNATLTGYKEILLINVITLSFIAYPYFKKATAFLFIPILFLSLYILPTLTTIVRKQSWTGNKSPQEARGEAFDVFVSGRNEDLITNNNWAFLTRRFSEIAMFCQYLKNTPEQQPYYGLEILKNAGYALIPRVLWMQKPNTEKISMERVYKAGVVHRLSPVSAKTRTIIDGYLSAGLPGVFISMLLYGLIAQWLCNKAEELFGGYELGCMIIFNGIFQPLWRGNNWEFIINNMVYGFILMLLLFYAMKHLKIIKILNL